jgi:hypothetical protein
MNIVIDVEADGPCPPLYSMVSIGAVVVDDKLDKTFYAEFAPISDDWIPDALAISNISRETHLTYPDSLIGMTALKIWLDNLGDDYHVMWTDNPAFDCQWINYYGHKYLGHNPFGHSARRIGDVYCGMKMDMKKNKEWKKKYRKTAHTHNPVDDAMGNAEALLAFEKLGLKNCNFK